MLLPKKNYVKVWATFCDDGDYHFTKMMKIKINGDIPVEFVRELLLTVLRKSFESQKGNVTFKGYVYSYGPTWF